MIDKPVEGQNGKHLELVELVQSAISQSAQNTAQITHVVKSMDKLADKLDVVAERFDRDLRDTKPSGSTMAAWASVILFIVVSLLGAMFYYFNTRFLLADEARKESWQQVNTRIERVENNQDESTKEDARRWRDSLERASERSRGKTE